MFARSQQKKLDRINRINWIIVFHLLEENKNSAVGGLNQKTGARIQESA